MKIEINSYRDLEVFINENIQEGVNIEYKSSKILESTDIKVVSKTVSAFANSAGGVFVIGASSTNEGVTLDGGWRGASKLDWIHRAINSGTFPPVESASVSELVNGDSRYYVIAVSVSADAPHQTADRRYYKRRGAHSDPMEHYEIEDVRNRPRRDLKSLSLSITHDGYILYLCVKNISQHKTLNDVKIYISTDFASDAELIDLLRRRGLWLLPPGREHLYDLGELVSIFQSNPNPVLIVSAYYEQDGQNLHDECKFFLADYLRNAIVRSPLVEEVGKISQKIGDISAKIDSISQVMREFCVALDGTGLRLSINTVRALQGEKQLLNPKYFDWKAYCIIAGVSDEDAIKLKNIFHRLRERDARLAYEDIEPSVRSRFENFFMVVF